MSIRILPALAAALAFSAALAKPYSEQSFERAMRGYMELAHDNLLAAANHLYLSGIEQESEEILRDATYAAVRLKDLSLIERNAEKWYELGGGSDALNILIRIKMSDSNLGGVVPLLRRLAETSNDPQEVYSIISRTSQPKQLAFDAMRDAFPLEHRQGDFSAYLALLMVNGEDLETPRAMLDTIIKEGNSNLSILLVRLLIADLEDEQEMTIALSRELAELTETNLGTALAAYNNWRAHYQDPDQSIPSLQEFDQDSHSPAARLRAGLFLLTQNEPDEAMTVFNSVPRRSPEWADAVLGQVAVLRQLGGERRSEEILRLLEREIRSAPEEQRIGLVVEYANELASDKSEQEAFKRLRDILADPKDPDLLFELSVLADRAGELAAAEAYLQRYIEIDPESPWGYNALAYLYSVHNIKIPEARRLVDEALKIRPDSAAIIDTDGWILFREGKLEESLTRLSEAVKQHGKPNAEMFAHIGEVLWQLGRHDEARAFWAKALSTDAEDRYLLETLERYASQLGQEIIH